MLTGVQLTSINNAQGSALALSILGIAVSVLAGITAGWFLVRVLTPVFVTTKDAAQAASDPKSRASMFFDEQKVYFDSDLTADNLLSKNQDAAGAALRPGATPDQMQKADDYTRLLRNLAWIRRIEDSQARVQDAKIAIAVCTVLVAGGIVVYAGATGEKSDPSAAVAPRPVSVNVLLNANGQMELAPLLGSACASAAANGIPAIAVDAGAGAGAEQATVILVPTATCPEPVRFVVAVHQGAVTPVASVVPAGSALPDPPGTPPGTAAPSTTPTAPTELDGPSVRRRPLSVVAGTIEPPAHRSPIIIDRQ